jgi:hypothetical protein
MGDNSGLEGERPGVRVVRSDDGYIYGFQDPGTGRFISRAEAATRLSYDSQSQQIQDSFGNEVGIGALARPKSAQVQELVNVTITSTPLEVDPAHYKPAPNENVTEVLTIRTADGEIKQVMLSGAMGEEYDPTKTAKAWGAALRDAAGLQPGEQVSTSDLEDFIISSEFITSEHDYN